MVSPAPVTVSVPAVKVASAQAMVLPLHAPDRRSTTVSNPAPPTTVMVWDVAVATNEYQTSSSAVPVKPAQVIPAMDWVAEAVVPDVAVQVAPGVIEIAPAQSSFDGGGRAEWLLQSILIRIAFTSAQNNSVKQQIIRNIKVCTLTL